MLRVRWLGRVRYADALALQRALFEGSPDDHLLLLEHPHVYTLGVRADMANVLVPPAEVGAELVRADRGGDVTYHGPGQLTGYPVLTVAGKRSGGSGGSGGMADTVAYVRSVEQLVIDVLADLGLAGAGRLRGLPGVWIDPDSDRPRKVAAVGVKVARARTMHGFALNVDPDLGFFYYIVPCGVPDKAVTSLAAEGLDVSMREVVDAVAARAVERWGTSGWDRQDVTWRPPPRLRRGGATQGLAIGERKPDWLRAPARMGPGYLGLKATMRDLSLATVCEEAGCPNIYECWADGTATFMINGRNCTRACGFCLVDTSHPEPLDEAEPERVAEAVDRMGLAFAVLTAVARDDLADGGAAAFAASIRAIRRRRPATLVEVLIPDCKGDAGALETIFAARPDVLNHNLEPVARLPRAVRPSAGYARSLAVLARAKAAGLTTKSGLILGMGERDDEVEAALGDLRSVGVDIVTLGQYLRPTTHHVPIARWWTPEEFSRLAAYGESLGIGHVEASPLTRSSYHARQAAATAVTATASMTATAPAAASGGGGASAG
ncbi:hypothetical protein BH18ACT4_BH18ACT4_06450 [soil metagenome]